MTGVHPFLIEFRQYLAEEIEHLLFGCLEIRQLLLSGIGAHGSENLRQIDLFTIGVDGDVFQAADLLRSRYRNALAISQGFSNQTIAALSHHAVESGLAGNGEYIVEFHSCSGVLEDCFQLSITSSKLLLFSNRKSSSLAVALRGWVGKRLIKAS